MEKEVINSYFEQAVNFHVNDKLQEAHDLYRAILEIEPNNHHCSYLLGVLYLQHGFVDQGQSYLRAAGADSTSNDFFHNSFNFKLQIESRDKFDEVGVELFTSSTIDSWRHFRMIDFARTLDPKAKWLTIGDQKGHDYWMLSELGFEDVTASNLFDDSLFQSSKVNPIKKYRAFNAEKIDASDCSYDYILCKEALHHMPRPYMALYEMLRVANKAVFVIEPQDPFIDYKATNSTPIYREVISDDRLGKKFSYRMKADNF
jgi:tetratricopeptide (TPR) repeat protein